MEKLGLNECYLITFEEEKEIKVNDKLIKVLSFYKWLMGTT
jgi:hypothetical protein